MYCSQSDLYLYGVPRGSLANPGRLAASVSTTLDSIELDQHGLSEGDAVTLRAESGGSLPSPLVSGVVYYALPVDADRVQLTATVDGAAIDLTTIGSRVVVVVELDVDSVISWASRMIDDMLPGHSVPLEAPVPELVRATCAELAAARLLALTCGSSASLASIADLAQKRLARWARGVPLRGTNAPDSAGLATSMAAPVSDSRGWRRYGGIA